MIDVFLLIHLTYNILSFHYYQSKFISHYACNSLYSKTALQIMQSESVWSLLLLTVELFDYYRNVCIKSVSGHVKKNPSHDRLYIFSKSLSWLLYSHHTSAAFWILILTNTSGSGNKKKMKYLQNMLHLLFKIHWEKALKREYFGR